jgi:hypothetical protein
VLTEPHELIGSCGSLNMDNMMDEQDEQAVVPYGMDPNSQHQLWSLWTWTVKPERAPSKLVSFGAAKKLPLSVDAIKTNIARFAQKCFGNAGQMNVSQYSDGKVEIKVRVEGHPVHDPAYVQHIRRSWDRFLVNGFGQRSKIEFSAKLEAGDVQDGKPREQLIIIPPLKIG